jgi:hypothetical protein
MKNFAVIALLIAAGAVPALADVTYNFTYTGSYFQATGSLDVNGSGLAVSGTGTLTWNNGTPQSEAITLLNLNGSSTVRADDGTDLIGVGQQVYVGSDPVLDGAGVVFCISAACPAYTFPAHTGLWSPWGNGPGSYTSFGAQSSADSGGHLYNQDNGSFSLSPAAATPDGGTTLALLGLAVTALAVLRRKFSV